MTLDEEKRQLFQDYQSGKITPEQFAQMRAALGTAPAQPSHSSSKINPLFLVGGGVIIVLLVVIAYMLFWSSPDQAGKRVANNIVASIKETSEASNEAAGIITDLRALKSAAMLFYADNMDDLESKYDSERTINGTDYKTLLGPYLDNPKRFGTEYRFIANVSNNKWYVGIDVSKKSKEVRQILKERAEQLDLVTETLATYNGGTGVYLVAMTPTFKKR
jgi:hypothetical protein